MGEPLNWTVVHEPGSGIALVDASGQLRATVVGQTGAGSPDMAVRAGRVPDGWVGRVTCPDGRSFPVANGRTGGLARPNRTAVVELDGSSWTYRHTSDRRAVITRDDHRLARVHRPWRWWRPGTHADRTARIDYTFSERNPQLTAQDELMITLFAVVLGPPGREGAIGLVGHTLFGLASIFS
jgi:hypothetical protein